MAKAKKKQEALSVSRLINEVLVAQLSIPFRQIVNDTTFSKYTGSKRPDILLFPQLTRELFQAAYLV